MLDDIVPREPTEITCHELVFKLEDRSGGAFAFRCDERGHVYPGRLPELARHCLGLCREGDVDGFRVRPGVVRPSTRSYLEPASGRCGCGQRVVLEDARANVCEACGREYDGDGLELTDRSLRGEEAGEGVPDTELGVDPERHG